MIFNTADFDKNSDFRGKSRFQLQLEVQRRVIVIKSRLLNAPGNCGSNGMSDAFIGVCLDELQASSSGASAGRRHDVCTVVAAAGAYRTPREGEIVQLVQQRRALSLHHMVDLPQSQVAVAQTVGGALRTARVVIKERRGRLSCFANE
jgi:hypothetical protein